MANAPRIMVTLPTPHDATSQMARVLYEEGLLGDYVVPLNVERWPFPRFVESNFNLGQWRYPIPAVSGSVVHEFVVAGAFRLLKGRSWARGTKRLARWRSDAIDSFSARRLKAGHFDAVSVLHGRSPRLIAAANRLGVPVLLFLHGDPWTLTERLESIAALSPDDERRREILAELRPGELRPAARAVRKVTALVVESSRMASVARAQHPGARVTVLGQGVDAGYFVPAPREYSARRLRIVQVSRVLYGKGVHVTNEAVALAREAVATCTLAGGGGEAAPLLVRASSNITFEGGLQKHAVRDLLQRSDVFVLPTFADPMPRAVLEAMACGLPVITTPDSGYEDLIEDGVNGFIVPVGDAGAVAALLIRLAADPALRERVGAAARVTAEENTWEVFAERFREALFAEILPALGVQGG